MKTYQLGGFAVVGLQDPSFLIPYFTTRGTNDVFVQELDGDFSIRSFCLFKIERYKTAACVPKSIRKRIGDVGLLAYRLEEGGAVACDEPDKLRSRLFRDFDLIESAEFFKLEAAEFLGNRRMIEDALLASSVTFEKSINRETWLDVEPPILGERTYHAYHEVGDFGRIPQYSSYISRDPFRYGLQFPAIMNELGRLTKRILDVGTGDGLFPRLLARQGARVVGYDKAAEKIVEAKAHQDALELGVEYVVAAPQTFGGHGVFDAATSVMVLPYASDVNDLAAFFRNTREQLVDSGEFVSTVLNPSFSAFDENLIVRRIKKLDGNLVQMEFLNETSGAVEMNPIMHQYTREEYEAIMTAEGMTFEWKALIASPEALAEKGAEFWRPCHETQPYALLIARKR
jgi:2-polyprenyl-3-methyl-5-hydroxy-6-metoxy-1,4-benzoquinol methylase